MTAPLRGCLAELRNWAQSSPGGPGRRLAGGLPGRAGSRRGTVACRSSAVGRLPGRLGDLPGLPLVDMAGGPRGWPDPAACWRIPRRAGGSAACQPDPRRAGPGCSGSLLRALAHGHLVLARSLELLPSVPAGNGRGTGDGPPVPVLRRGIAPGSYLYAICARADEIQTGLGRTGRLFAASRGHRPAGSLSPRRRPLPTRCCWFR
jgi:hypothetical protein